MRLSNDIERQRLANGRSNVRYVQRNSFLCLVFFRSHNFRFPSPAHRNASRIIFLGLFGWYEGPKSCANCYITVGWHLWPYFVGVTILQFVFGVAVFQWIRCGRSYGNLLSVFGWIWWCAARIEGHLVNQSVFRWMCDFRWISAD